MVRERDGLVRGRLLAELCGAPGSESARRVTVVAAPAGCGKTTLLAHHAASFPGPVAWLRLEPGDAAPPALARRLRNALAPLLPDAGGDAAAAVDASREIPPGGLLVVDDLHYLYGTPAEGQIERLLSAAPVQAVLASRRMPGINLHRHELGPVTLVGQDALRFRTWEVERLFRDVYAEPLLPEDAAVLTRRAGGWAAGLHMFHLSTSGRSAGERGAAVRALDGRLPQSQAYLARTVLADLPEGARDFLVRTCVFTVLTAERCDLLLGTDDARRHLHRLAALQAFTLSPDHGRTFRYHEALRAHLEIELAEDLGEQGAREWHGRAAALLEAEGAYADAAQAYARAADWPAVRRLIPKTGLGGPPGDAGAPDASPVAGAWHPGPPEEGDLRHDELPAWLVAEEPLLLLAQGRHLFSRGRADQAVDVLRQAEQRARHPSTLAACRRHRALAATWSPRAPVGGTPPHWTAELRAATRANPGELSGSRPVAVLAARLLCGDVAAARRLAATADPDGLDLDGLVSRLVRGGFAAADGDPGAAVELERVADDAERARLPWLSRMSRVVPALGGTEPDRKEARRIAEECERDHDPWGALLAASVWCAADLVWGRPAQEAADEVVRLARPLGADVFAAWAGAVHGVLAGAGSEEARRADAQARAAGVPAARTLATAVRTAHAFRRRQAAGAPDDLRSPVHPPERAHADGRPEEGEPVVRCFGGFAVQVAGQALDLSGVRPKARTVLRLLAVNAGRPVHRDVLLAALWPDSDPAAATRGLHVALSALRTSLSAHRLAGVVARRGEAYLLDAPCDVARFRRALRGPRTAPALESVLEMYGGDLLPEDGAAEWVVHEREVLRTQAAECASELAALRLAAGRPDAAVLAAARCLEIDEWHDPAWRTLIDAYDRLGDVMSAARTRRRYSAMLDDLEVPAR
ncbi:BTAD domain-containing putative transcriptional regulator [Planotetraspora kaengkrachanensis]|uniref:OmpR/PhoB-type domain-containing protein n=1 Tax=Planotetraspora kaengkrachanensis TaxID=575193 RepID=A0A8J3PWY0_9ACTN|nr:winged helix-turn-helix domain-containing protein [Planotetraspora kaengkrachanensis]GIG82666.1 hypothetical protein Pka01_57930 [Planotetraspora kaengkrachanensis]